MCPYKNEHREDGQALVMGAFMLMGLIAFSFVFVSLAGLYKNISHIQDAVNYAAEIAARPDGLAMTAGDLSIDESYADAIARAELQRSLTVLHQYQSGESIADFVNSSAVQIDFANPPATPPYCTYLPDGSVCYSEPAVRVKITVPVRLWLFRQTIDITREGVATTGSSGAGTGTLPTLDVPTPVMLPTVQITPTSPGPTAAGPTSSSSANANDFNGDPITIMVSPLETAVVTATPIP